MCDRVRLAVIAGEEAEKPYNGKLNKCEPNIQDIVALFPKESTCSLAGCVAWEEWARADSRIEYHSGNDNVFQPAAGDIVLFDRVFNNTDHDHIGIVLENYDDYIITVEGNVENVSRILERKKNNHIRAYIRIPDNFSY